MNAYTRPMTRSLDAPPSRPPLRIPLDTPAGMALLRRLVPSVPAMLHRDRQGRPVQHLVIAHGPTAGGDTLFWAMVARYNGGATEAARFEGAPAVWTGRQLLGDACHRWRTVLAAELAMEGVTWPA